jgi:inner membrane protein involved in colicin E2 resistance
MFWVIWLRSDPSSACHNGTTDTQRQAHVHRSSQTAAGIFIALSLIGGVVLGVLVGEPSIGLLGGLAAGIALAALSVLVRR